MKNLFANKAKECYNCCLIDNAMKEAADNVKISKDVPPHNCGTTTIKGIKTTILLVGTTIKGKKLFFRRITLVFFLFIFLVNGNLVVVDYCTSY